MRKVSVIIPVYKVEEYLDRCIESVVNQKYKNLEIILVDDGSPDNCPKMCDDWAKKDNRIKVIHKENGGLSSARNAGLKVAAGDIITFIDSDDYVTGDFSVALEHLPDDFDAIYCPFIFEYKEKRKLSKIPLKFKELGIYWKFYGSVDNNMVTSRFYKSSAIKDMTFDETMHFAEDIPFTFSTYIKCNKVFVLNIPWYIYNRNNPTALTRLIYPYKEALITLGIYERLIKLYESTDIKSNEKKLFLKRVISEYLLGVLYKSSFVFGKEKDSLLLELKKFRKYITYGSNLRQNLARIGIKLIGLKNTSRLIHLYVKVCKRGK